MVNDPSQVTASDSGVFSRLFAEGFLPPNGGSLEDFLAPRPIAPSGVCVESPTALPLQTPMLCTDGSESGTQNSSAESQQDEPLVNVLLIVDPSTHKVIFPGLFLPTNGVSGSNMAANIDNLTSQSGESASPQAPGSVIVPPTYCLGSLAPPFHLPVSNTQPQNTLPAGVTGVHLPFSQNLPSLLTPTVQKSNNAKAGGLTTQSALQRILQLQQSLDAKLVPKPKPPLRALSAYNFFFRDERERIIYGKEHDWSLSKQEQLLAHHWSRDRTKKRRHRKTHGKIDFTTLSKLISTRWKELPEERKEFYRQVAARDWDRYQEELHHYKNAELASQSTFLETMA